jgi:hypothetical protein
MVQQQEVQGSRFRGSKRFKVRGSRGSGFRGSRGSGFSGVQEVPVLNLLNS